MRSTDDVELAASLAGEWIERFPDLSAVRETELLDRLIRSGQRETLRRIGAARIAGGGLDDERRRNWDVVELLVDFDAARARLETAGPLEPGLLWNVRARLGSRHEDRAAVALQPAQLAWIVRSFRGLWRAAYHPPGPGEGHDNA